MKHSAYILTLTVTIILALGGGVMTSQIAAPKKAAPQSVTVVYGDVPVSFTADNYQMQLAWPF